MNKNVILTALGILFLGIAVVYTGAHKNLTASLIESDPNVFVMETNQGDIKIELDYEKAPKASQNFAVLATSGKYDGTIFHRVINDFMIQGGDYENFNGTGGESAWGGYFENEISDLSHVRGALSMANTGQPSSNGSQFFIVQGDNATHLDGNHTVFGRVTAGMDIVDSIATTTVDFRDKPDIDIVVEKVSRR